MDLFPWDQQDRREMDLVSGYDSDSDEEKPAAGLSSLLPAPSASSSKSVGPTLPPPSLAKPSQKKRPEKRQIRIDALDKLEGEEEALAPKRAKVLEASNGKSGLSGLLGMLPAPKQKGPPPSIDEKSKEDAVITQSGVAAGSESRLSLDSSVDDMKKAKGNNDFRAMLGLKPSKLPEKVVSTVKELSTPATIVVPSISQKPDEAAAAPSKAADFFPLSGHSTGSVLYRAESHLNVSTAPAVEDEQVETDVVAVESEDQYKGWQQGPDGSWFPVTPRAHAVYTEYLSKQAITPADNFVNRPADMMYGDINSIQSVDANASRDSWQSRPPDSAATGLDRKYAMAAASIATPDQGIPLVDQEEEVKKMDKKTNFRARRKGQLSALIAQAEENREKLEERWSKGKDGRNAAKVKYGF